ncbi:hypothetical protein ANN_25772 [Periplaneta americana]|uniref:Uncharacterized protein n=1 Tax=Periplaneta americana TaxID=6978 RepID=A0ABQ8S4H1_PERAM|nr:hypothetical protein ANN_25772 [Periplaneta americana]
MGPVPTHIVMHLGSYDRIIDEDDGRRCEPLCGREMEDKIAWRPLIQGQRYVCIYSASSHDEREMERKNSLRRRDLNPGFQLYVLMLYPLSHAGYNPDAV